ncbi:expressed unknown protein [Seminavis robusta]|uniref:Mannitol dehydrogenase N-terminal domain-containing protein n=1 Tax=Seminavis robusta TaxID=568900 RepID=A0A9N8HZL1_9STRA|nr:expressed unknown protein [Seminavis robusta]|eukprot:Sro2315_g322970.1 n/a (1090) ;mRNA; r:7330-10946
METPHYWLANDSDEAKEIDCLCLGTGRFLRSVLIPPLVATNECKPALIQTRGTSFVQFMSARQTNTDSKATYPIDTVQYNGETETVFVKCFGAFSLGHAPNKDALYRELIHSRMTRCNIIGLGVTEAGLSSPETQVMKDLYELLTVCCQKQYGDDKSWQAPNTPNQKLCIINMDNVPNNGDVIQKHMLARAASDQADDTSKSTMAMTEYLQQHVAFLNTMVDRITSQRPGSDGMIPRCEPIPAKALVICDPRGDLPTCFRDNSKYGLVIRTNPLHIQGDIALKLRVANATHTAIAQAMALLQWGNTDQLALATTNSNQDDDINEDAVLTANLFLAYLDALVQHQIVPSSFPGFGTHAPETKATYFDDWRPRLTHAHFGLATFFITQNAAAKGGIRLGPTVRDLLLSRQEQPLTVTMAFAFAVLLRWLTPRDSSDAKEGIFIGWLAGADRHAAIHTDDNNDSVTYADGLRHNWGEGWYEFKCACKVRLAGGEDPRTLSQVLASYYYGTSTTAHQPADYQAVIRAYLLSPEGGNLGAAAAAKPAFGDFVKAIATLYARMVAGDSLVEMLEEMQEASGPYNPKGMATECAALVDDMTAQQQHGRKPLFYRPSPIPLSSQLLKTPVQAEEMTSVVISEVASTLVIDLHTHLLPPSHGMLCLWGFDELLTYHYLVAEYFMTAPASMTPESFYALGKREQADVIWQALFVDRSPVSEACRGVITTLVALGLSNEVATRDLEAIRRFYASYRDRGLEGTEEFSERVFAQSGVQYAVMTNIPFDTNEAQHWRPERKDYSERYRSALRVDPLLSGDRATIEKALKTSGYEVTLEGARQYLRDWCDTMKPEYMMASTPHDFVLREGSLAGVKKTGVNEEAMKQPFAFVDQTNNMADCVVNCDGAEDDSPTVLDENSDFLSEVLMKVCEERNLPVALKIGAHRGVNKQLQSAGDGVVAFADAGVLSRLCSRFPKVLFLATFLSRNNQHEAAVLASKFRNLHIYGCWWFCNNPSIIREITQMRVEMLGTAFTAQHSDARVLDQLLYKWPHSRAMIANVLAEEYAKLDVSGWTPTRGEIRRDISRLFGGSYEEFLTKSLSAV